MMRKFLPVLSMVVLLGTAGCGTSPETASVENNSEMMADALERKADNLEAMADGAANASVAAMLEGAADNLEDRADDIRDVDGNRAD